MGQSAGDETRRLIETLRRPTQQAGPEPHIKVERPKGCVIVLGGTPNIVIKKTETIPPAQ